MVLHTIMISKGYIKQILHSSTTFYDLNVSAQQTHVFVSDFYAESKMALISPHHIAIPMNRKQSIVKISILKRGKCNVFKNEVYSTETNLSSAMFFNELVPFRTPKVVCHCAFNVQTIMILLFYSFDVLLKTSHQ